MYHPRSTVMLISIGFTVVLAPLMVAVITAIVQVDRLAAQSRSAVLEAEVATQHSRRLVERITPMRRAYMQYHVTGDSDFREIFAEQRGRFLDALRSLNEAHLTAVGMEHLRELNQYEQILLEALTEHSDNPESRLSSEEADGLWAALSEHVQAIFADGSRLIEGQANRMTDTAAELQRTLTAQATAVIPATILLAVAFVFFIARPMRALGWAIRRLGAGEFSEPINVHGSREIQELGQQLDWLRRRIQDLERQKLTFLRHISHELKTPLTTIREGSELLSEALASGAPEEAEISRIMNASSVHLQKLIEDLLLFAKMQDLVSDLKLRDGIDLQTLVQASVSRHSVAAGSKQLAVECDLRPVSLRGDDRKLQTVMDNLLSNAVKYTPAGGRILISLKSFDGRAVIDVEDTGPGIDESEAVKIFEPFQQGRATYQSSVKGTGLGLSIAKEYVEAHDGCIETVNSTQGAHFRVELPLAGPEHINAR